MKAAVVERDFEPVRVKDIPAPAPVQNELLVRVTVAGVNPFDWKQREERVRRLPFIAGQDFAGIVEGVGRDVRDYRPGDRVVGIAREHGSYAQYTVVPQDDDKQPIAHIPDGVSDADAAALPTAGITAYASIDALGVRAGTIVLICGATGGVGSYAVQIAHDYGALVIGSARASSAREARSLGADEFVAYDREDVAAVVRARYPKGIGAILDLVDDAEAVKTMASLLREGGSIVSTIGSLDVQWCANRGVRGINIEMSDTPQSSHAGLRTLLEMVEDRRLRVTIGDEYPLADAERALEESKRGHVQGKMLLTVSAPTNIASPAHRAR